MELRPFRALRYDATCVPLADVVAPPYDVIDDPHRDRLYARHPHNVVRLILNRDADRYGSSAAHLGDWLARGVLRQDDQKALWLYAQTFGHAGREYERTGVIGAVRLEPFSAGHIRPHERTLSGPKADRMRLLESCRTNLSPIFGLYANQTQVLEQIRRTAGRATMELADEFGVRHRAWAITDAAQISFITETLGAETIFIADGHHRYETALEYRDHLRARSELAASDPANFIMMFLCSMADPGLLVLPTHRIVQQRPAVGARALLAKLQGNFVVRELPNSTEGRERLLAALAANPRHIGLTIHDDRAVYELSLRDDHAIDGAAPELPAVVRHLDVTVLDRLILREVLGLDADSAAKAGQLRYSHEAEDTFASVASGTAQLAFLLGPPDLKQVEAVCLSGETMPQKSTYFYPKLLTGLVFHALTPNLAGLLPAAERAQAG